MTRVLLLSAGLVASIASAAVDRSRASDELVLTPAEIELALELSPLPDPPRDPTNAVYENPAAARLGQALFFDERLSGPGTISCATCHDPLQSWGDGRQLAEAVLHHPRHTMTLWNVAYNRWFFWDGRKDTLWSQALAPLEDAREHATSRLQVAHVIASDPEYREAYGNVFGKTPDLSDSERFPPHGRPVVRHDTHPHAQAWATMDSVDQETVDTMFANVGKAIAAYERLLVSRRAPFDVFVEGLRSDDGEKLGAISEAAQRGFALFVGKGQCVVCHDGPNFSDSEFHTNRVPTEEGVDPGRPLGIRILKRDPFNSRSRHADDGGELGAGKLAFPKEHRDLPGKFKTPTLRNVARSAPYMHEGQIDSLQQVVRFYSTLEGAAPLSRLSEKILSTPLDLTAAEQADLVAFLETLTDESLPEELLTPPPSAVLAPEED